MARRTLITFCIALTVVAFVAAEADFWNDARAGRYDHFHSNVLTSFRVYHRGEITLDETQTGIVSMSPDALLEVSERRFLTRRRLTVQPGPDGAPQYALAVGSRERSEADAREFLSIVIGDVVRGTTIGARPRARRLLAEHGVDGVLREVAALRGNSLRAIYVEEAAAADGLTAEQAARVVRTAGREISSSSRLRATLVDLAERLPADWPLTADLATAAEEIASSAETRAALVEIARLRSLDADAVEPMARALGSIAASSEKRRAIVDVAQSHPRPDVVTGLLEPVETIAASSDRRRALEELTALPEVAPEALVRAMEIGRTIPASSDKASLLVSLAGVLPPDEALQIAYLRTASTIAASSEHARALRALLEAAELPPASCTEWIRSAGEVAASSVVADLLVEAAARCPGDVGVWRGYLQVTRDIASSVDQRRAFMALLDRNDLAPQTVERLAATAGEAIASTAEREAVLARARAWEAPSPAPEPEAAADGQDEPEAAADDPSEPEAAAPVSDG